MWLAVFSTFLFLLMVTVVLGQGDIYLWSQIHPVLKYDLEPLILYLIFKMSRLWPCVTLLSLCGDGDRTQGFVPARQALCHLSYAPALLGAFD